jgi:hypothetical protein
MVFTKQDFNERVNGVEQKQSKLLRRGYTTRVDRNGIIIAKPKPRRFHFPVRGLLLLVVGFVCFKAFMLAANGPDTYQDRLATLQSGNAVEVLGARVLSVDPATQLIADKLGPLLR